MSTEDEETTSLPDLTGHRDGLLGRVRVRRGESGVPEVLKSIDHARTDDLEEFRRHFESLARLEHPHLVDYLRLESNEVPITFAEEYVDGTDVLTYLRRAPTPGEIRAVRHQFEQEQPSGEDEQTEATEREGSEASGEVEDDRDEDATSDGSADGVADASKTSDAIESSAGASESTETIASSSDVLEGTEFPEVHTYVEAKFGEADTPDVVLDPPREDDASHVELIDVVFLRLERLMPQILGALEYLHRFRIAHGDIKPSNILVDSSGRCELSDFGLRGHLALVEGATDDRRLTPPRERDRAYADAYLAPECREEFKPGPRADLFALGCVLFEAITGCRPYDLANGPSGSTSSESEDFEEENRRISEELDSIEPPPDADLERAREELESETSDRGEEHREWPYEIRASALSELEPRCPAAWTDLIIRLLDPDPERRPGFDEIRELLASSRGRSVDIPPSFVPEQESFFGRDEIFDPLVEQAQTCVAEESLQVTLLSGEAGYGKTAMAERLAQWAAQRGWVILRGRCYTQETLLYQGWREIAAQLGDICRSAMGELDESTDRLRRRASRLFAELHPESEEAASEPLDRLEAVAALRSLLRTLSAERPILILFDDLNWASWDTAALLSDLIAEPEGLQCMVVGTWRTGSGGSRGEQLLEEIDAAPLELDKMRVRGFHPAEAEAYVDSVADLDPELRSRLLDIGGENPLLLEELIYQLHLHREEDRADQPTEEKTEERERELSAAVPELESLSDPTLSQGEKLVELLERRLDGLSRREMFVTQLISIASLPVPESILSLVVDREFHTSEGRGETIAPILDELRSRRLVRQVKTARWNQAFTLFHNVTRDIVREEMHEQHLTHLCDLLADALRQLWPEAIELHFVYLVRAERTSEALDTAVRTARRAEHRFAHHRSASLWRWIAQQSDDSSRFTSLRPREELAHMERLAHRPQRAAHIYRELAESLPSGPPRAEARLREFETLIEAGRRREALSSIEDALGTFDERYARSRWIQKLSEWKNRAIAATNRWSDEPDAVSHEPLGGQASLRLGLYRHIILKNDILESTRGEQFRAKFSAAAERSKDALLLGYDRLFLARDCHYYGISRSPSRADEWYDETEQLFETCEDAYGLAQMAVGRARLLRNRGEFDNSETWIDRAARRLGESTPVDDREAYLIDYERALLHQERGELESAIQRARRLRHFYRGNALAQFRAAQVLIPIHLLRGDVREVERLIDECETFLEGPPPCVGTAWLARQKTRLNLALDRPEVAHGELNILDDQLRDDGLMGHPYVALAFHASRAQALIALVTRKTRIGEPRREELFKQIKSSVDRIRGRTATLVPPLRAETERLLARFALLRNDEQSAFQYLEAAMEALAGYPNPIARSMCAEAQGLAFQREDPEQGTSLIEQSRVIYDHHGCHYPLVLEAWPVPRRMAKLKADAF